MLLFISKLCKFHIFIKRLPRGFKYLQPSNKKNVTNAEIYQCKGQIFYTWKQMDECRKNFKNAIHESSCSPVVYREFAFELSLFKVTQKRLQYIQKKGMDMNPENLENFVAYADILNCNK